MSLFRKKIVATLQIHLLKGNPTWEAYVNMDMIIFEH